MSEAAGQVVAQSPEQRRSVAVAALMMAQVAEQGGTSLSRDDLLEVAERALESFEKEDRAAIFEEMVAVLDWLADNLRRKDKARAGDPPAHRGRGDVDFDPGPLLARLEEAIQANEDVVLDYFSFHRKAWNQRRVTPRRIDGEFLVADCHLRGDERRFRVTRIRKIAPPEEPQPG